MAEKIKKHLRKKKDQIAKEAQEINGIIDTTNQLLLSDYKEDEETKRALNIHSNVSYENDITETNKRLAAHDKIYKRESFSGKDIKELCNKYDLRILPISQFNGKIPPEMYRKIREFVNENPEKKIMLTESNFYILAPVEMFETTKIRHMLDKDPIVFYREPNNGTYDRQISQKDILVNVYDWGNDFSEFRRLRYFFNNYKYYSNDGISNFHRSLIFGAILLVLTICHLTFIPSFWITTILMTITVAGWIGGNMTEDKYLDLWNTNNV